MTASERASKAVLQPCRVKGCPWRGEDPEACPMHEQVPSGTPKLMVPETITHRRNTRHR